MKENKILIEIDKPVKEVFEFTINPKNTPLWISNIQEEISTEYPPVVGTIYKNRGDVGEWDFYKVIEFKKNQLFTMKISDGNYHVRYTYKKLSDVKTEMEYFEWVEKGELENPFTQDVLNKLKEVIEIK